MWIEILERALMSEQFGERFREIVKLALGDGSQGDLARKLNVSQSAVQKWLAGNGFPSSENMAKIAKAAGLSGVDALNAYLKGEAVNDSADNPVSAEDILLLTKGLSKEERKRLIELMLRDL